MIINKEVYGVWILYNLEGRLDAESAPELDQLINKDIDEKLDMAFNFKKVEYISSMGIRTLMNAAKKTSALNHRAVLCNLNDSVKEVVQSTGIDGLIDIYDDISELPFANDFLAAHKMIENSQA